MTTANEPPSKTGLLIRDRISAIMGVNHHSNRQVARLINKSEQYVRNRVNGKYEWTLKDIETYGTITGYQPSEITAQDFTIKPAA